MDSSNSNEFDCNICLDSVQDPVVTLCGHLYCWPCIYRWLHLQAISSEQKQQCPVCKSAVSEDTLVPLFVKCQSTRPTKSKARNLQDAVIPRRPLSLACGYVSPRSPVTSGSTNQTDNFYPHLQQPLHYSRPAGYSSPILSPGSTAGHLFDPVIGVIEEIMYARDVGNSIGNVYNYLNSYNFAGSSPRLRRHIIQADICLSRICFFLFCCVFLCLLLF